MIRNTWRAWVLAVLLAGPILLYIALGTLWLWERGWIFYASLGWMICGLAFAIFAARWTRRFQPVLPPIPWDSPRTFAPRDREAWGLVESVAQESDEFPMERLVDPDLYVDTGKRLAELLSRHYHPDAANPIAKVPVVELLTALELASEDLGVLCRDVPGGDMITPAHFEYAVQAADLLSRANDVYTYVLPFFSPLSGLARLGSQKLMVQPAWKQMRQNLLRWFFQAYVNRLGVHLIELYSGRLVLGAASYRRLTRPPVPSQSAGRHAASHSPPPTFLIAARGSLQPARWAERLREAIVPSSSQASTLDPFVAESLRSVHWADPLELPDSPNSGGWSWPGTRKRTPALVAADCDLLLLLVDPSLEPLTQERDFMRDWASRFDGATTIDRPPVLLVPISNFETSALPSPAWRAAVAPVIEEIAGSGPPVLLVEGGRTPESLVQALLPALASQAPTAERHALLRLFRDETSRSKAGRLVNQLGQKGRAAWSHLSNNIHRAPRP